LHEDRFRSNMSVVHYRLSWFSSLGLFKVVRTRNLRIREEAMNNIKAAQADEFAGRGFGKLVASPHNRQTVTALSK